MLCRGTQGLFAAGAQVGERSIRRVGFDVAADAYGRFMGRFSSPLAAQFVELAELQAGQRVLDVGCGPGALTAQLVSRLGQASVSAVDPSAPFVAAIQNRFSEVDARLGVAEKLPFDDKSFDGALAQLVVHFMSDPVAGLSEMARVTRPRGWVAACVWDHGGGAGPLSTFWAAVQDLDASAVGEADLPGAREDDLGRLFAEAGFTGIEPSRLTVTVPYATFEEWWEPYTLSVGVAGDYLAGLDPDRLDAVRNRCRERLPDPPFDIDASAWCVRAPA
jgi:SAM-dependent methyltransferase